MSYQTDETVQNCLLSICLLIHSKSEHEITILTLNQTKINNYLQQKNIVTNNNKGTLK